MNDQPSARKRTYRILPAEPPRGAARTAPILPPPDVDAVALRRFRRTRREMIAEAAYYKAAQRGFAAGDPDRDWREAEAEIEELLRREKPF